MQRDRGRPSRGGGAGPQSEERARVGRLVLAAVVLLLGHAAGCREPLFPPREARTQYDRYDRSREQFAPDFVEDEFGRQEPNLRGRLSPKDG